jgi:hypothetical protein
VLAVALMAALAPAGAARAQESAPDPQIVAVGWWTRSATQQAPKEGLAVATAPDGPVTLAAISVSVGDAEVISASLQAVETGGFAQDASSIQACYTADNGWKPVEGGSLDDAPQPACGDGSVLLSRDGDARIWSGELGQLFAGRTGTVSIMLVPGDEVSQSAPPAPPAPGVPPPPPSVAPAFDVRLAAPTLDAQATEASGGGGSVISGDDDGAGAVYEDTSGSSAAADAYAAPASGDGAYTAPPAQVAASGGDTGGGGSAASALDTGGDAGGDDDGTDRQAFRPVGASSGEGRPWGRGALYVLIAAVLGVGAGAGRWVLRERIL